MRKIILSILMICVLACTFLFVGCSAKEYTIKFVNGETVIQTVTVKAGETPQFTEANPTKDPTVDTVYTFDGWGDVVPATADATYTAQFTESTRKYKVTFLDGDEENLLQVDVEYGTKPSFTGSEYPTKLGTEEYSYEFKCWDEEFTEVEGEQTYSPLFYTVYDYTATAAANIQGETTSVTFSVNPEDITASNIESVVIAGKEVEFTVVGNDFTVDISEVQYTDGDEIFVDLVDGDDKCRFVIASWIYQEIDDADDLVEAFNSGKKISIKLTSDITYEATDLETGDLFESFKGILDGNGYTLTLSAVSATDYAVTSIFGDFDGEIKNINITYQLEAPYLEEVIYGFAYHFNGIIKDSVVNYNVSATFAGIQNFGFAREFNGTMQNCVLYNSVGMGKAICGTFGENAVANGIVFVCPDASWNEFSTVSCMLDATDNVENFVRYATFEAASEADLSSYVTGFIFTSSGASVPKPLPTEPTLISNATEFAAAMDAGNGWYKLADDIDITATGILTDQYYVTAFTGILDGDGYTLTFDLSTDQCFFESIFKDVTGTIKNVKFDITRNSPNGYRAFPFLAEDFSGTLENVIIIGTDVTDHDNGGNVTLFKTFNGTISNVVFKNPAALGRISYNEFGADASIDKMMYCSANGSYQSLTTYNQIFNGYKNTTNFVYVTSFENVDTAAGDTTTDGTNWAATSEVASYYVSGFEFTATDCNFKAAE